MESNRRQFLRNTGLVGAGALIAPILADQLTDGAVGEALAPAELEALRWEKAPCRFCGTGCGTLVGLADGRVKAVRGDPEAPVNKGLLCAKGYGLAQVLYPEDRLTTPQIREKGKLRDATWEEALDLIATRWKALIEEHGPDSVAVFGSGQWTIPEGYAALKWLKGGIRTNNLEPNARFCMASAVVGYLTTYGMDEPMGCYDDFEVADRFVLWGANMAEMHPMLFNRILQRRAADPNVRIVSLQTYHHMTDEGADDTILFEPHSDLLIANGIAHLIVKKGLADKTFLERHVDLVRTRHTGDVVQGGKTVDEPIDFEAYAAWLETFTPEAVSRQSGVSVKKLEMLSEIYGDPGTKVVSLWTMGANQHTRGVWINNLVHNLHLLTAKVAKPGNSPFSLTGQPSACGTCREVGTFTHRLPSDRVVMKAEHRAEMEKLWGLPAGTIPGPAESPLTHATAMWDKFGQGKIKSVWVNTTNPFQTLPNVKHFVDQIRSQPDTFMIVSDAYPTVTVKAADVVLPSACWVEKEGMFGNTERRTHHFAKLVEPPGQARPDVWQFVEVARRMGYEHLFPRAWDEHLERHLYEDYRKCTLGTAHDVASYEQLLETRGVRWPVVDGRETRWRYNAADDPYAKPKYDDGIDFYGKKKTHRAVIFARPYEPPMESPDDEYPYWLCTGRVLEHWHTGTMTRRVPQLHRAVPEALCYLNAEDAAAIGVKKGAKVRLVSRRASIEMVYSAATRIRVPRGTVYVPFFDEDKLINELLPWAIDPMSKQPDYKKSAVRVEKIG